jgi:hypothetical protein
MEMKKIFVFVAVLAFLSCKKSFLEREPISNMPSSAFYKTEADMQIALNSAYSSLQLPGQYGDANWQVGEVRSDNTYNWEGGGSFPDAELDQFKQSSSNSILNTMWLDAYGGIFLCNLVIDRIVSVNMDDGIKKQFTAEALFLRSLMYFNLVRTFGDVPLVLKETVSVQEGYTQGRDAVSKVYDQIVSDLTLATEDLPAFFTGLNVGRVTQGAANALLGKVLLSYGNYELSASVLKKVISSETYHLLPDYADLWRTTNANNAESVFEVQFKKGGTGTGSAYTNFFAPRGSESIVSRVGFAYGKNLPTADLVAAYEIGDIRKDASLAETYTRNNQPVYDPHTVKYKDIPFAERDADNNWVVLRYADVLLMYAEVLNELNGGPDNEAYNMIKLVRQRAGLDSLAYGMSKTDFAMAVEHERQVELAFEGHRWFDLVRTGRALQVMNAHFDGSISLQPYQLLFPIPQRQININPTVIFQNEGY